MKKNNLILLIMIVLSSVLVALTGVILKYGVMAPLGVQREESVMEIPFLLFADESLMAEIKLRQEEGFVPTETETPAETPTEPATEPPATEPPATEPPATEPPETEPENIVVDEGWFEDALFIGDSRTVGLQFVNRLGEADYFCDVGMTVYGVRSIRCYDDGFGGKKYLKNVLEQNSYGKVFIHLGLNECGGVHDNLMAEYEELVALVRELQPDAVIILQEVMTVTEKKAQNRAFTLERIGVLNARIEALADGEQILFLKTNEAWLADENGYMMEEVSYDGAHPSIEGYNLWAEYLMDAVGELPIE